jgi:hypothetical protein
MGALARPNPEGAVSVGYGSRGEFWSGCSRALIMRSFLFGMVADEEDVFMLNRFPCRMVEVVGWVAGVDEKEKSQTLYREPIIFRTCTRLMR